MSQSSKLYIAGMGMVTAMAPSVEGSFAAFRAGISGYSLTNYRNGGKPVTMALVNDSLFESFEFENPEPGDIYNLRHERMVAMSLIALNQCLADNTTQSPVHFTCALPEDFRKDNAFSPLLPVLEHNLQPWFSRSLARYICTGRCAGLEAVDFSFRYLQDLAPDYLVLTSADSPHDESIVSLYGQRLLSSDSGDGFVPGEAACALLLTPDIKLAQIRDGCVVALHQPGSGFEEGHFSSDAPYKGEGLDGAFKAALQNLPAQSIEAVYSCMNGENYWAREYGVAFLRNKNKFVDELKIEHPADCFGDLGSATGLALTAMAVEDLHRNRFMRKCLVYASSDQSSRMAMVMEKIDLGASYE